jgi:hypothetical protein
MRPRFIPGILNSPRKMHSPAIKKYARGESGRYVAFPDQHQEEAPVCPESSSRACAPGCF